MQLKDRIFRVPESVVEEVVKETSEMMGDANYVDQSVSNYVSSQPAITQYVLAHQPELGNDGTLNCVFHATILGRAIAAASGSSVGAVSMEELDQAASSDDPAETLRRRQPHLAAFIDTNVLDDASEDPLAETTAKILFVVVLAMASRAAAAL